MILQYLEVLVIKTMKINMLQKYRLSGWVKRFLIKFYSSTVLFLKTS